MRFTNWIWALFHRSAYAWSFHAAWDAYWTQRSIERTMRRHRIFNRWQI